MLRACGCLRSGQKSLRLSSSYKIIRNCRGDSVSRPLRNRYLFMRASHRLAPTVSIENSHD